MLDLEVFENAMLPAEVQKLGITERLYNPNPQRFKDVDIHPEPVDGEEILNTISSMLREYVILNKFQADAAALWLTMTWFADVIHASPLALISAPERACGKSQMLGMFENFAYRPMIFSNVTPAYMYRSIDLYQPTFLLDEADSLMSKGGMEMANIINAGHMRKGAWVGRVDGKEYTPKDMFVWGPKALAGIALDNVLEETTLSRGLMFRLKRKLPTEKVKKLFEIDEKHMDLVRSKLARFAIDTKDMLYTKNVTQDFLHDRDEDNWMPLLMIASCAGPVWYERAVNAARLMLASGDKPEPIQNRLLRSIRSVFQSHPAKRISSVDLVEALISDEEGPWKRYKYGRAITCEDVANILSVYGIGPKSLRVGKTVFKGYDKDMFTDAFARYIDGGDTAIENPPKNLAKADMAIHIEPQKPVAIKLRSGEISQGKVTEWANIRLGVNNKVQQSQTRH